MPRGSRIDAPGLLQHVMARGIEKRDIFRDNNDRLDFLERLEVLLLSHDARCFAWVLIPNHFHLLIRCGKKPLSSLMRRLLTGYAIRYNSRHRRSGHLFQNRYKSIVCQEETYLLELVAYIHLNPLRAGLVSEINDLDKFSWSGHAALVGTRSYPWQETDEVLALFAKNKNMATRKYRQFAIERIGQGKRNDLIGGGLTRSTERLANISNDGHRGSKQAFDERILGQGGFVEQVLREVDEQEEESNSYKKNTTTNQLLTRIAQYYDIAAYEMVSGRKRKEIIPARSVFSYLATEYLGIQGKELAIILKMSPSAISHSVTRGEAIVKEKEEIKEFAFGDLEI